ncbi:uncharacterized protein LOC117117513 [Anneissia japonica]|uniref:uncharacterized protein LOC117117513 n=1 Tax=Anneissia japonica TaxID=1529436 RepID=UPI001425853C|nr:uncharacterized protein LOC117117513 [Anneissia japonica]
MLWEWKKAYPNWGAYSPLNIKEKSGQCRVYIRPIQHALNMDSERETDEDSGLTQKCPKCQNNISFCVLKKHLASCASSRLKKVIHCMIQTSLIVILLMTFMKADQELQTST